MQAGAASDVIAWSRWSAGWQGGYSVQYANAPLSVMAWKLPTNIPTTGTVAYSLVVSFVLLKLVDLVLGLRASEQEERIGLDLTDHREAAYTLLD